jgi:hypothetical protein
MKKMRGYAILQALRQDAALADLGKDHQRGEFAVAENHACQPRVELGVGAAGLPFDKGQLRDVLLE